MLEIKEKISNSEKPKTLMSVLEILDQKCYQLMQVADLTETLNQKLNRTEGHPICEDNMKEGKDVDNRNIIKLFEGIAQKMQYQINVIGKSTEDSINMIE